MTHWFATESLDEPHRNDLSSTPPSCEQLLLSRDLALKMWPLEHFQSKWKWIHLI